MRRFSGQLLWILIFLLAIPAGVLADKAGDDGGFVVLEDPVIARIRALESKPNGHQLAPLWDWQDSRLQAQVNAAISHLGLSSATQRKQLAITLTDISDVNEPRVAEVNGNRMMYAASLPKIAILLAAFEQIEAGELEFDSETEAALNRMIRRSSNEDATDIMRRVGKPQIADVLLSPRYLLYDPRRGGGLWVGKDYARSGLWRRDPLHNLSHGATAMQVARFYYLLETDNLVSPESSQKMKKILSRTRLRHKFVKPLRLMHPEALMYRKSGSWRTYHSDSVLVKGEGRSYIAVALSNSPKGSAWLGEIIQALDAIIYRNAS